VPTAVDRVEESPAREPAAAVTDERDGPDVGQILIDDVPGPAPVGRSVEACERAGRLVPDHPRSPSVERVEQEVRARGARVGEVERMPGPRPTAVVRAVRKPVRAADAREQPAVARPLEGDVVDRCRRLDLPRRDVPPGPPVRRHEDPAPEPERGRLARRRGRAGGKHGASRGRCGHASEHERRSS
jgi:hypothetical protein